MTHTVVIKSIALYPIKSLDPILVPAVRIIAGGSLEHDREFALADPQGQWINGKREPGLHRIRAHYDLAPLRVTLSSPQHAPATFHLLDDAHSLETWFENFFGYAVTLQQNTTTGFPDDLDSPGPTIVGSASLQEVRSWFDISDLEEVRRRFRPNIELDTESPFWEDRLFGAPDTTMDFRIGDVAIQGVNPCQRCVVPSRDPSTGVVTPDFQRAFAEKREQTLPAWVDRSHFNHYYRLTVNTRIPSTEAGKWLHCGDEIFTASPKSAGQPSLR
jgi:hypothetical protein